jgi:hypothetical protein
MLVHMRPICKCRAESGTRDVAEGNYVRQTCKSTSFTLTQFIYLQLIGFRFISHNWDFNSVNYVYFKNCNLLSH